MKRIRGVWLVLALGAAMGACEGPTVPGTRVGGVFRMSVSANPSSISPRDSVLVRVVLRNASDAPVTVGDGFQGACPLVANVHGAPLPFISAAQLCAGPGATAQPINTLAPRDSIVGTRWWPGAAAGTGEALPPGIYYAATMVWLDLRHWFRGDSARFVVAGP